MPVWAGALSPVVPRACPLPFSSSRGLCRTTETGLPMEPTLQTSPVPFLLWAEGLKAGGGPASYPPTPWVGQLLGPRCAERNGVSETRGASLSSGRTFEAPDSITYWPATHLQQRRGNHNQASCPTASETVVRWCRTRSFSSIILNVEKILFLWLCKLPFDFIQKKKSHCWVQT